MLTEHTRRPSRTPARAVSAVGVVIPARNEATRIRAAIEAVAKSCRNVTTACTIVVVDDGSSDETAVIAAETLLFHDGPSRLLRVRAGRASTARRVGCEAFGASVANPATAWVLSTDADSVVAPDWVARYLRHHERGEVAVAGIVGLLDDCDGRRIGHRWRADYGSTLAPDGGHPHVHAANLGVRLDVLDQAGGFGNSERIEDIELWDRVRALGIVPRADANIVVGTSARLDGRVRLGFAAALERIYG